MSPASINATGESATIFYTLNSANVGGISLEIYASNDSLVRRIDCGEQSGGSYNVSWNGKDGNGAQVPDGLYRAGIRYTENNYLVAAEWGSYGGNSSQLDGPSSVAIDAEGNVYVTEYYNHRVQKFGPSGQFLLQWGGGGSGNGEFSYPAGIAVGANGIVYVVDYGNDRVQMFSSDGGYIGQWGSKGSGDGQFDMPHGIALDNEGSVYVADMGNDRIQKFSATGEFIGKWGSQGKGDGQFTSPMDIAIGPGDTVYVTDIDSNNVQMFTTDGSFLGKFGSSGSGDGQFNGASGIAIGSAGYVYVCDIGNHRIQQFDSSGSFIASYGGQGQSNNLFSGPCGIALSNDGSAYIADLTGNDIQMLTLIRGNTNVTVYKETNITVDMPISPDTKLFSLAPARKNVGLFSLASLTSISSAIQESTAPVTVISISGVAGNNSWYLSSVIVSLSAQDKSGTGIKQIDYSINGQSWAPYSSPFPITEEGTATVQFYAVDNAGHQEQVQSANVRIDKTPPKITGAATTSPLSNGWYKGVVTVHFEANDALSGMESLTPDQAISTTGQGLSVIGTAIDYAGNKATCEVKLNIDNTPPVSACSISGIAGGDGWYRSDVQVNFSTSDGIGSGVKMTEYSFDGGNWQPAVPILINKEGLTTIYFRSVDQVGNIETPQTIAVKIDKTAPTITGAPLTAPGPGGWYDSPVTVHFTADDALSGIASVSDDQTIKTEGAYQSVTGIATDKAGNAASAVVGGINIDMSPPVTSCTLSGESGSGGDNAWYRSDVNVTLTASDGSGIGVQGTEYMVDNGPWTPYTGHFNITKEGISYVHFRSTDLLNQVETEQVRQVKIDRVPPPISYTVSPPLAPGQWYTDTVVVHFTGSDDKSGIGSITPDIYLSEDGANQSVIGYAYDMAGNMNWTQVTGINIDRNSPVTMCTFDRAPSTDGWFNTPVNASLDAFDNMGTGANWTEYRLNGTDWTRYTPQTQIPIVSEGANTIYYRSIDNVSHLEPINARSVNIDMTAPSIGYTITGGAAVNGWYTHSVTVHFYGSDLLSGIKSITPDRILTGDGAGQTVTGTATDKAGNTNSTTTPPINIDRTSPVTSCSLNGVVGNNSWYTSPVGVVLQASDGSGSGVGKTVYSVDGTNWHDYAPFTINDEGRTTVYYYSIDNAGNTEPVRNTSIMIDYTAPEINFTASGTMGVQDWYRSSVSVSLSAFDKGPSGLGTAEYSLDGVNWTKMGTFTLTGDGSYNVRYRAYSNAGKETSGNRVINIDRTVPTIGNVTPGIDTQEAFIDGLITVAFNESMDQSSVNADTFYLASDSGRAGSRVQYSHDNTFVLSPDQMLEPNTKYTALLTTGAKDLAGNRLTQNYSWSFTTGTQTRAMVNNTTAATPTAEPTPTPEPAPTEELPSPTAAPAGNAISGIIPIVLTFVAILAIGGIAVFYLLKIKK